MQDDVIHSPLSSRRQFLKASVATGGVIGVSGLAGLASRPTVFASERQRPPHVVPLRPEIEPLVRLLEDTPRDRLIEEVGRQVRRGLQYRDVLAALLLAGVRNVEPRPVGFKFHAVMVVYPVHLASVSSPQSDRWLPIFWALDDFKRAQFWDAHQDDWTMGPVNTSDIPPPQKAKRAFIQAMDQWDEAAADTAVVGLARTATPADVFDILCRYGARDFRDIGHKAIYVANAWRTLRTIGWQHAEPVLRSLAYALLAHEGSNPAWHDAPEDRPFRRNQHLMNTIRSSWQNGPTRVSATTDMLHTLRHASTDDACDAVVDVLNRGIGPQSIWDALFNIAVELLMRQYDILALHAVTTTNAMHFAFQTTTNDATRRLLLLQNAAFITLFRRQPAPRPSITIDQLQPGELKPTGPEALAEIFAEISDNRGRAARKALAYLHGPHAPQAFMDEARRLLLRKSSNAHDYKFTSAVLEDYAHVSPAWRDRYLAASVFNLRGSGQADNPIVKRTRAVLDG